jgi:CDP-paratose 2-epimerase
MKILITGGAGFIGCNLAEHLIHAGHDVLIYDDLSRRGAETNLQWLRSMFGDRFDFVREDICDSGGLERAAINKDIIYHLAAQVAVTSSVIDPRKDFEVNALGSLNVLEAARTSKKNPIVFYASTNKVYGSLEGVRINESANHYEFEDLPLGVPESQPLDFHSPYGCSKGTGDQYTRDYYRIYGLQTVVFRQSCIYGLRQFGVEDQGWLAHFAISAFKNCSICIYGDGKQVRDVLFIDDLIRAIVMSTQHIEVTAGQVYNIGGGPTNTLSVWTETRPILEKLAGHSIPVKWADWRPGDQRIYVSDINKARQDFGWVPQITPDEGIRKMWDWIHANGNLFL